MQLQEIGVRSSVLLASAVAVATQLLQVELFAEALTLSMISLWLWRLNSQPRHAPVSLLATLGQPAQPHCAQLLCTLHSSAQQSAASLLEQQRGGGDGDGPVTGWGTGTSRWLISKTLPLAHCAQVPTHLLQHYHLQQSTACELLLQLTAEDSKRLELTCTSGSYCSRSRSVYQHQLHQQKYALAVVVLEEVCTSHTNRSVYQLYQLHQQKCVLAVLVEVWCTSHTTLVEVCTSYTSRSMYQLQQYQKKCVLATLVEVCTSCTSRSVYQLYQQKCVLAVLVLVVVEETLLRRTSQYQYYCS